MHFSARVAEVPNNSFHENDSYWDLYIFDFWPKLHFSYWIFLRVHFSLRKDFEIQDANEEQEIFLGMSMLKSTKITF